MIDTTPCATTCWACSRIVSTLQAEDGNPSVSDGWTRPAGGKLEGDGLSQLVEEGHLLERGGCNFSHVKGASLPPSATQHRPELAGAPFEALGVSLVMHPRNPYVPTVHMNVRCWRPFRPARPPVVWFGGGMDLTPYYGFEEDARHFHRTCRDALAPFGADLYPRFKPGATSTSSSSTATKPRGIGGIFFDDFTEGGFERGFALMQAVGDAFVPAYLPIVQRRRDCPTASANATSRPTGAAATSSSTWCGTAARTSACTAAAAPRAS
jgi:coproporphyrinogen III oxidase